MVPDLSFRPEKASWQALPFRAGELLIPQPSFPVLRRRRISALLDRATHSKVTLVCGPPGSGKTLACASWAAEVRARRVVWLTMDPGDQQSWFWAHVCAGLSRARVAAPDLLRSLADTAADRFPLRLAEVARAFTEPVVLLLDDVHEMTDPAVLSGLAAGIWHAPGMLRLVLCGRRPPALPLARLRAAGEVRVIGGQHLACTADEADAYLRMLGIEASPAAREQLLRCTQGWMAGLGPAARQAQAGRAAPPLTQPA